jgi:hypothetical protein
LTQRRKPADALSDEAKLIRRKDDGVAYSREHYEEDSELGVRIISRLAKRPEVRLADFVNEFSIREGYTADEVLDKLMELQEEGRISLSESRRSETFFQYMTSPKSFWSIEVLLTIVISLALLLVTSGPALYVRYVFGAALVVFVPGYTLVQAIYVKQTSLDDLTRFALAFALSLALVALIGLVLGVSPLGLGTLPIADSVALMSIAFLFVAVKRRYDYYKIAHAFD